MFELGLGYLIVNNMENKLLVLLAIIAILLSNKIIQEIFFFIKDLTNFTNLIPINNIY